MALPTSKMKPLGKGFTNFQFCVSLVIQNPIKLTVKINPYTVGQNRNRGTGDKNVLLDPPEGCTRLMSSWILSELL